MKTEDLTFVADALLELCDDFRKPPNPYRRERCCITNPETARPIHEAILSGRPHEPLLVAEIDAVWKTAKLTKVQEEVLELRMEGMSFGDIGMVRRTTKQAAQKIFLQAIKKFARALHVYPYTGLADVYRFEVRRGRRSGLVH